MVGLEVTNAIFMAGGFISLTLFLNSLIFCRGTVCSSARASAAFAGFEFCLWTATSVLTGKDLAARVVRRARGGSPNGSAHKATVEDDDDVEAGAANREPHPEPKRRED